MFPRTRVCATGIVAICLGIGVIAGSVGGAFSLVPAGAATSCNTGINIGIGATILEGATATPAPSTSTARVGDTIKYTVQVSIRSTECAFSHGTVTMKTPNGVLHTLMTGVSLAPGATASYPAPGYVVTNADIGKNSATAGNIAAAASVTGTATETGGTWETVTASTHYDLGVIHPETLLTKSASSVSGAIPLKVTYTFKEKNVSTDPTSALRAKDVISTVNVSDATGCSPVFQTSSGGTPPATTTKLQVGATWTYTCSETFSTVGTFIDHATGTGTAGDGREAGTPTSLGAPMNETAQATVTATKAQPLISTTQQPASGTIGVTALNDKVTLSKLVKPVTGTAAGTITVELFAPSSPDCSGTAAFTDTLTATTGNGTYTTTGGPTANAAGTWHWTAFYSGDKNNRTATSGCSAEPVVVSPAQPTVSTSPQPASAVIGSTALNDKVTLSGLVDPVTGTSAGTITVELFAPSSPTCTGDAVYTDTLTATTGNGSYTTTGGPTANGAGVWHWTAVYSGDANNQGATSGCSAEPVTIAKATPGISTTPQPTSGTLGSTALNDKVTLSGLVDPVTDTSAGTITVDLYPPSSPTCTGDAAFTDVIPATAGDGSYATTGGPMADAAGVWHWTAVYSGDVNNQTASSACTAEPVTIAKATPGISTTPQPAGGTVGSTTLNDKVTLSGLVHPVTGPSAGTITVALFAPSSPSCTGDPVFTDVLTAATGDGSYTTTGGPTANGAGIWHWTAVYSGDANNKAATSSCSAESVTITKATPGISTTPQPTTGTVGSTVLNDKVTLSGLVDPVTGTSAGKITVELFAPSSPSCTGDAAFTDVITAAAGNGSYTTTGGPTANSAGVWHWTASYAGDVNNMGATSGCSAEPVTIAKATPAITTTPQPSKGQVGSTTLNDKVTLSGLVDPVTGTSAGKITVELFAPSSPSCTGDAVFTETLTATAGNGSYTTTGGPTANAAGIWHWTASYAGDANNKGATSGCAAEPVTVHNPPSIKIVKSATPLVVTKAGQTVTYTFVVTNTGGTGLTGVTVTDKFTSPSTADALATPIECVSLATPTGTCSGTSTSLAIGQSATFKVTYAVTPADLANGVINNSSTASGTSTTTPATKVTSPPSTASVATADLVTAKSVTPPSGTNVKPTQVLTYTLTFANTKGTAPAPVTFTDTLKDVTDDAAVTTPPALATGSGLTVGSVSGTKFTITGTVPAKTVDTVTFKVTVNSVSTDKGNHVLNNYLIPTGTTTPKSCLTTNPDCTTNPVPAITIVKSATPATVATVGQTVTYKFVVTNTGGTTLSNVSVTDKFTSPATDTLTSPIDCVSLANPTGTCSGTTTSLAVGQSATFTVTYKVTSADLANKVIDNSATATGNSSTPKNPTKTTKVTSPPSTATVKVIVTAAASSTTPTTTTSTTASTPAATSAATPTTSALASTGATLAKGVGGGVVLVLVGGGLVLLSMRRRRRAS